VQKIRRGAMDYSFVSGAFKMAKHPYWKLEWLFLITNGRCYGEGGHRGPQSTPSGGSNPDEKRRKKTFGLCKARGKNGGKGSSRSIRQAAMEQRARMVGEAENKRDDHYLLTEVNANNCSEIGVARESGSLPIREQEGNSTGVSSTVPKIPRKRNLSLSGRIKRRDKIMLKPKNDCWRA